MLIIQGGHGHTSTMNYLFTVHKYRSLHTFTSKCNNNQSVT